MPDSLNAEILRELSLVENHHLVNTALEDVHPRDIAEGAADLTDDELWLLLRWIGRPLSADIFAHLPIERQVELTQGREPHEVADLLEAMSSDDRVDLVQQLDPERREDVLDQMEAPQRQDVERLEAHPEGSVGAVMSTDVATLRAGMTASQAIEHLRTMAGQKETIYYNYVVDDHGRLLGIVSLRDLVMTDASATLTDVMNSEVITVSVDAPVSEAANAVREYDLLALPVVDGEGRLAGIVTVDDVLDVAEEEASEDFDRIAAVGPMRMNLGDASLWLLYRKRIPWLLVLVFVNILSGAGIALFEGVIAKVVSLVFFLPVLIGSGGNAGAQAATLTVRALATGEVAMSDWLRLLGKEVLVALSLGVTMALGVSMIAHFRAREIVPVVAMTMLAVVMAGSLIGILMPFIFTRLNLDPATASGPLITSMADICGVLIYFSIATWYLGLGA